MQDLQALQSPTLKINCVKYVLRCITALENRCIL